MIGYSSIKYETIRDGLFKDSSLMDIFPSPPPDPPRIVPINMISTNTSYDPWILPHSNEIESYGTCMPFTPIETSYDAIQSTKPSIDIDLSHLLDAKLDQFYLPNWETISSLSHDFLNDILPSDEAIMEVMALT